MILSDRDLIERFNGMGLQRLVVEPRTPGSVQPASIDLHLSTNSLLEFSGVGNIPFPPMFIDPRKPIPGDMYRPPHDWTPGEDFTIGPGQFLLGDTIERLEIPDDLAARVDGKSSRGRIGLAVHITAGWIDPGFKGTITLEMLNVGPLPIVLSHGLAICQLTVSQLSSEAIFPYHGKYQGQAKTTGAR